MHGDSLEYLPMLKDECADMIFTDPPYNVSNEVTINRASQGKYTGTPISLDFGDWDHFEDDEEYREFCVTWMKGCARILKPGGAFITFFDKKRISWPFEILEPMGFKPKDIFVWVKSNPVPQVRKVKFAQATEFAAILQKDGGGNPFNWQLGYHPNYIKEPICQGRERLKDKKGKTLHMTQKPERVVRVLMDYFSKPGDLILDPFSGTGTMAVVAAITGRRYIAIEALEKYYQAALKRLERVKPEMLTTIDYKSEAYKAAHR